MTRLAWCISGYLLSALVMLWPMARSGGRLLPGTERGDLWNGLWSFWAFGRDDANRLLGFPDGGVIEVADLVNAWIIDMLPGAPDVVVAWSVLVFAHVVMAGVLAHLLALRLQVSGAGAWLAGLAYQWAPVQLSGLHNGSTEAVGAGWLAAAVLGLLWAVELRDGQARHHVVTRCVVTGVLGALCTVANWYAGVCFGIFLVGLSLYRRQRATVLRVIGVFIVLAGVVLPVALKVHAAATSADSVVRIKMDRETELVRRTIGAVDPVVFVRPGDYRSPDFRVLSRYGEDFIHCAYVGWSVLLLSAVGWRRRKALRWLGGVALGTALLSLGPVLVSEGQPLLFADQRGVPLPYFLLEALPGFSALSLLYRLGQGVSLALALLAGAGLIALVEGKRSTQWLLIVVVLFEFRFVAPTAGLPHFSDASESDVFTELARAPDGAVMNFPVVGGRRYLFEQTLHGKPLAASLNFPNNPAAQRGWETIDHALRAKDDTDVVSAIGREMKALGLRYLVVHSDPFARPDMHDRIVQSLGQVLHPLAQEEDVLIYALW